MRFSPEKGKQPTRSREVRNSLSVIDAAEGQEQFKACRVLVPGRRVVQGAYGTIGEGEVHQVVMTAAETGVARAGTGVVRLVLQAGGGVQAPDGEAEDGHFRARGPAEQDLAPGRLTEHQCVAGAVLDVVYPVAGVVVEDA